MNQEIWVDCIDKLSDLGFDVDAISTDALPTFPLSQDSLIEPIILRIMNEIVELEDLLNGCASMAIERTADDYKVFAFERGFLTYGNDEMLNNLLAISFLIDELQMNRIMMYRRTQSQEEIISPNKNIPALKQRIMSLGESASSTSCSDCNQAFQELNTFFHKYNPCLLENETFTNEEKQKISEINKMCESLYHDKKIMMIQRLDVTIQSLLWDSKVQYDCSSIIALRNEIDITYTCSLEQVLDARRSLLESICRVSTLRGKNKAKFREIRISNVPDRGGRVVVNCADDLKDSRDTRCYRVNNKRTIQQQEESSQKINKPSNEFNETQKVLEVFGSAMNKDNVVCSSNN